MLEAHDLTKRYGAQTALNGLNPSIALGEVFCRFIARCSRWPQL